MSADALRETAIAVALDRLILVAMLLVLATILTAAMVMQYAFGEIPCPLCLLQRFAMFGCCFGIARQLRSGELERGTGIALIFAIVLLVIAVRQTLLDLFPRAGHDYVGSAIFGVHMPVWSVFIAVALLLGFAVRLALFGAPRVAAALPPSLLPLSLRRVTQGLTVYVALLCALNFASVVLQCGLDQCHTFGYRLLQ
jgi:disulfide bond formation protein DsbB